MILELDLFEVCDFETEVHHFAVGEKQTLQASDKMLVGLLRRRI